MSTVLATLNCSLDTGYAFMSAGTPVELEEEFVEELRGMGHVVSVSKIRRNRRNAAEYFDAAREEEFSKAETSHSHGTDAPANPASEMVQATLSPVAACTNNTDDILDSIIHQDVVATQGEENG